MKNIYKMRYVILGILCFIIFQVLYINLNVSENKNPITNIMEYSKIDNVGVLSLVLPTSYNITLSKKTSEFDNIDYILFKGEWFSGRILPIGNINKTPSKEFKDWKRTRLDEFETPFEVVEEWDSGIIIRDLTGNNYEYLMQFFYKIDNCLISFQVVSEKNQKDYFMEIINNTYWNSFINSKDYLENYTYL